MSFRFIYANLAASTSGAVFSASSSASATLGPSNVVNELKAKVWRTGTSTASETLTVDLLASTAITGAMIFAHDLTSGDSLIQLRKSTDNFAANDVLVGSFTYASGAMFQAIASTSSRYWRIAFTKSAAGQTRNVGVIFLCTYADVSNPDYDGWDVEWEDLSTKQQSIGGQTFCDVRPQRRKIKVNWSGISAVDKLAIKTAFNSAGTGTGLFIQSNTGGTVSTEDGEYIFCKFRSEPRYSVAGFDSDLVFDCSAEFEEII